MISLNDSRVLSSIRRKSEGLWRHQEHIHLRSSIFNRRSYAFLHWFAIVTLWLAFQTAKTNVAREAESMMMVDRTAKTLPDSEALR